jgi:hypothetical protein
MIIKMYHKCASDILHQVSSALRSHQVIINQVALVLQKLTASITHQVEQLLTFFPFQSDQSSICHPAAAWHLHVPFQRSAEFLRSHSMAVANQCH